MTYISFCNESDVLMFSCVTGCGNLISSTCIRFTDLQLQSVYNPFVLEHTLIINSNLSSHSTSSNSCLPYILKMYEICLFNIYCKLKYQAHLKGTFPELVTIISLSFK